MRKDDKILVQRFMRSIIEATKEPKAMITMYSGYVHGATQTSLRYVDLHIELTEKNFKIEEEGSKVSIYLEGSKLDEHANNIKVYATPGGSSTAILCEYGKVVNRVELNCIEIDPKRANRSPRKLLTFDIYTRDVTVIRTKKKGYGRVEDVATDWQGNSIPIDNINAILKEFVYPEWWELHANKLRYAMDNIKDAVDVYFMLSK